MGLRERIVECRPALETLDLTTVATWDDTPGGLKGAIGEAYVRHWLESCPYVEIVRDVQTKYTAVWRGMSLTLRRGTMPVQEFDLLVQTDEGPCVVEAKSGASITGIETKRARSLRYADELFGEPSKILYFFPGRDRMRRGINTHPRAMAFDIGYTPAQMNNAIYRCSRL